MKILQIENSSYCSKGELVQMEICLFMKTHPHENSSKWKLVQIVTCSNENSSNKNSCK